MTTSKQSKTKIEDHVISFLEFLAEGMGWLKIVASPLLLSAIVAVVYYLYDPTVMNLVISIIIVFVGLTIGVLWANKVWKGQGTVNFAARPMATPELDKKADQEI